MSSRDPLFDTLFRPTTRAEQAAMNPPRPSSSSTQADAARVEAGRVDTAPSKGVPTKTVLTNAGEQRPASPTDEATPRRAPRPTHVGVPAIASAAPIRIRGTRSRAGNAMNRTRSALLDGARRATTVSGTKITMAQVAAAAGVAKATLYNHFRTREAVLDAFLLDEVARLLSDVDGKALPEALNAVASAISLRTLARTEPGTLAAIGRIDHGASAWQRAEAELAELLASAGRGGGETVLRWLASFVISPADPATIAADLAIIIAGLPDVGPDREVGDDSTPPALRESALRESALRESALRKSALRESALRESTPADSVFGGAPNSVRTA